MQALERRGLDRLVVERAAAGTPVLGICLGMQLLTDASYEDGFTAGLGLVPGRIVPLGDLRWHIGWNTVDAAIDDPLFAHPSDQTFYFNHAYAYDGPEAFQACTTTDRGRFASIIRRGNVVGLQFHPEKSQAAGHRLLRQIVTGLRG